MKTLLQIFTNICRLLVAGTLILSGFVKAIDPLGSQYKINEYLVAANLHQWIPQWVSLGLAVALSALEFCLGINLLFAIRRRLTTRLVALLMLVMTVITVWIAWKNPVKDCGCFGDALVLTNTQTLLKNVVLLAAALFLAYKPLLMVRFVSKTNQWIVGNYTLIFILLVSGYCLYALPLFDFRPYKVGTNIVKSMEIPADAKQPKFETTFILQKNGVTKTFTLDNYPDSTWTFIDTKTVMTEPGYVPPIHDFSIQDLQSGEDITQEVLSRRGYTFVLMAPHIETATDENFGKINRIYDYAREQQIPFIALTASGSKAIQRWRDLTGAEYAFYNTDETTLKTIIRSNPGLMLIKNGVIINKWSHNCLPKEDSLTGRISQNTWATIQPDSITKKLSFIFLAFALPLFLLTLADRTWAWTRWLKRRKEDKKEEQQNTQ